MDAGLVSLRGWPDGRSIAFLPPDPRTESAEADRAAKRDWTQGDVPQNLSRLWILDIASHSLRRIAVADRDITDLNWSPDGQRLAVRAAPTTGLNDLFYHSELLVLNVKTGVVERKLFDNVFSTGSF